MKKKWKIKEINFCKTVQLANGRAWNPSLYSLYKDGVSNAN